MLFNSQIHPGKYILFVPTEQIKYHIESTNNMLRAVELISTAEGYELKTV